MNNIETINKLIDDAMEKARKYSSEGDLTESYYWYGIAGGLSRAIAVITDNKEDRKCIK